MRRREFVTLLGGAVATWPIVARAQQADRMRRIGVLVVIAADDPESKARFALFVQGLQQLGWITGQNVGIDYRSAGANVDELRKYAAELVALDPDVILADSSGVVASLLQATRTIPIVFLNVADPVGAGFVDSPGWQRHGIYPIRIWHRRKMA
jgi:putative tryptophan/tyrosine transport system substrate-binding protein